VTVPAWAEVAAKLAPFIARRVPPTDVDDVLQDVLLRMHRGFASLRCDDHMTAWMFQVARSAIADRGRDRARHPLAEPTLELPAPPDDERNAATALAACLTAFVARLPSPYREAITLVELEGMTIRVAAEMVGLSVSGMKSRVQRGRHQLREMLEACCVIAVDARGGVTDYAPRAKAWCAASDGRTCSRDTMRVPDDDNST
ncbi:MAG TPA: sigma-70 family RNA polymerase sigma factor, partial [Kofleriaceae bacterium]